MKAFSIAVAAAMTVVCTTQASAFGYNTCLGENLRWSSDSKTLRASPVSFPTGYWRNGLQNGMDAFNLNPSKFRYSMTTDNGGVGRNNGQTEVWGGTGSILQGSPARAYWWYTCFWFFGDHVHLDELDIVFDYSSPWQWTANTTKSSLTGYAGSLRPLQTTACHEFGHGLALNHVSTEYNVMGTDYQHMHVNGSTGRAYMGEDAADGAAFLYGERAASWEDVGVVHWKYSGASGEYSDHTRTRIYTSSGGALPTYTVNSETGYRVSPGDTVLAEFTYENMGKSTQSNVRVGYYISMNDLITTLDTRIAATTFTLGRGNVMTTTVSLTIPVTLSTNTTYWLGAIIDNDDAIQEAVEWNNATYIPIRVQ